jgi:hypothetical protein
MHPLTAKALVASGFQGVLSFPSYQIRSSKFCLHNTVDTKGMQGGRKGNAGGMQLCSQGDAGGRNSASRGDDRQRQIQFPENEDLMKLLQGLYRH